MNSENIVSKCYGAKDEEQKISSATSKDSLPSSVCFVCNAQNVGHHKGSNSRHRTNTPCRNGSLPRHVEVSGGGPRGKTGLEGLW